MPQYQLPLDSVESHVWFDALPEFVQGYIEAAFWTSIDYDGEEVDGLGPSNMAPDDREAFAADAIRFWLANAADLAAACERGGYDMAQGGHDLWLTRNRHGAGFWDRELGEIGDKLTAAAHSWGEADLFAAWAGEGDPDPEDSQGWQVTTCQNYEPLTDAERAALEVLTGPPVDPLPEVGGRYGAPMGRDPAPGEVLTARRVTLDPGGYDSGGAYWGTGAPLWRLLGADGATVGYRRGANAAEALA